MSIDITEYQPMPDESIEQAIERVNKWYGIDVFPFNLEAFIKTNHEPSNWNYNIFKEMYKFNLTNKIGG